MTPVVERLAELRKHLDHLKALRPRVSRAALASDLSLHNDVLFSLLTVCQLVIDVAGELAARRGDRFEDYTDAVRQLERDPRFPADLVRELEEFGVEVASHVVELGGVTAALPASLPTALNAAADASPVRCLDPAAEREMIARIDAAQAAGDTLGGVVEVVAFGLPVGLGSHASWDRKLDGRLAQAIMSIPAVKGVALGLGFEAARRRGSEVHDEILPGLRRATNRAGGTEGGMTTGEPLVVRAAMKPISTLMTPLATVDLASGAPAKAQAERSDVTAVPAMGVIAEAMTALVLAEAMVEKFGGDSLGEMKRNVDGYLARIRARTPRGAAS